jgi:hypothetical protein
MPYAKYTGKMLAEAVAASTSMAGTEHPGGEVGDDRRAGAGSTPIDS